MNRLTTSAIVLTRTNFGEADRILTVLTPDYGKLKLMARGVRKSKSKLAGSVELFCVTDITFIRGRGEISTLVSARLKTHYKNIVLDIDRINLGYEILKLINKNTEDEVEAEYFNLLCDVLVALDDTEIELVITRLFFEANLLKLAGQMPNLSDDSDGKPLVAGKDYGFDAASAGFSGQGNYSAEHIKFLRLLFSGNSAKTLSRISGAADLANACQPILQSMLRQYLRVSG